MTKVATVPAIAIADYSTGEEITSTDYTAIIEGSHYIWQRSGSIIGAIAFRPLFKITSTSYTKTTTETADYAQGFGELWASQLVLRPLEESTATRHGIQLTVRGINVDVRVTVLDRLSVSLGTAVATCGATWETATAILYFDPATYGTDIYCYIEAKVPVTGTAYVASAVIHEAIATASQIPRGR